MAINSVPVVPRDGTITVSDATGSPITLTVQYEDGDFQVGPLRESNMTTQAFFDRGIEFGVRKITE